MRAAKPQRNGQRQHEPRTSAATPIVACAKCGSRFKFSSMYVGKRLRCKRCSHVFTVVLRSGSTAGPTLAEIGRSIASGLRRAKEYLSRPGEMHLIFPSLGVADSGGVLAVWAIAFVLVAAALLVVYGVGVVLNINSTAAECITSVVFAYLAVPTLLERARHLVQFESDGLVVPAVGLGLRTFGNVALLFWLASLPASLGQEAFSTGLSTWLAPALGSAGRGIIVSIVLRLAWGPVVLVALHTLAEMIENLSFVRRGVERIALHAIDAVEIEPEVVEENARESDSPISTAVPAT